MKKIILIIIYIFIVSWNCYSQQGNLQDSLSFELCKIYGSDQGLRSDLMKYDLDLDSINFYKVIKFIQMYGYPNEQLLGSNYHYECVKASVSVVLLHNPHRIVYNKKYSDLLLKEVERGNLKIEMFLGIIDKYYLVKRGNNHKIYMGSFFGKPCIQDRQKSDSLRSIYGLPPLKEESFKKCEK